MIELTNVEDISLISDWAELNVVYGNAPMSKAKLTSLLEDNGAADSDALFDSVIQELEKRQRLYGANPPFTVNGGVISPEIDWNNYPEYLLCLIFSYWGAANANGGTSLFERISDVALKSYLNGETVILGFPNNGNLPQQIDQIAAKMFEDRAAKDPPAQAKDRGVDVIGWIPFGDERRGQIIVLMQCAAGRNWNLKKQIQLSVWSQYINWFYETTVPSMSITEIIPTKKWGKDAVESYGVVFDRARLYRFLYKPTTVIDAGLRAAVVAWCGQKLN
ncbi:MAG: hypothetical protein JST26_13030 [Bacteroidetes bacterium]|nr:hypothetical protein [Bacteroidota bacterium]